MRVLNATLGLAVLATAGCQETGLSAIADPEEAPTQVPAVPDIEVSTRRIDFGALPLPSTASATLSIRNVGDADLDVISVELGGGATSAFSFTGDPSSSPIAPGDRRELTITFAPEDFTAPQAQLVITSSDPDELVVTVDLLGLVPEPELILTPLSHDFGAPQVGATSSHLFTVENRGPSSAVLEGVSFTSSSPELRLVGTAGLDVSAVTLGASESLMLRVAYTPQDTLADESSFEIPTNVPSQPSLVAHQVGTGTGGGECGPLVLPFGGGTGTESDPYVICAAVHVDNVRTAPDAHFIVVKDIDMGSLDFEPLPSFSGHFDGGEFTLSNLRINRPSSRHVALFSELASGAHLHDIVLDQPVITGSVGAASLFSNALGGSRIEDVVVTDATVTVNGKWVAGLGMAVRSGATLNNAYSDALVTARGEGFAGGMIGLCAGTCTNLVAEGTVKGGEWKAGGLASHAHSGALIENAVSRVDVSAGSRVGGLISVIGPSTVRNCYAEGAASGGWWVGGLMSHSWSGRSTIENSYASGPISTGSRAGCAGGGLFSCMVDATITDSVWDRDQTGQTRTEGGGEGLSTAAMQDPSTRAFARWGSSWVLSSGDHPRLAIE